MTAVRPRGRLSAGRAGASRRPSVAGSRRAGRCHSQWPQTGRWSAERTDLADVDAVRRRLDDYSATGARRGAKAGREKAKAGQDRASRNGAFGPWFESAFLPALLALRRDGRPFTSSELRLLLHKQAPSNGSSGAAFRKAKRHGLIRIIVPVRGMARSTTPSAHRRLVHTWISADAALPDGYYAAGS